MAVPNGTRAREPRIVRASGDDTDRALTKRTLATSEFNSLVEYVELFNIVFFCPWFRECHV